MIRVAIGKAAYKDILLHKIISFFTGSVRANGYSILIFLLAFLPAVRDIPTVITKNYQVVQGSTVEDAKVTSKAFPAGIIVKDEQTGKTVRVRAYFTGTIKKESLIKISYLPNLKIGDLLERSE